MIAPAVLPMFAMLVAAPVGSDDGCPSARQVSDAMTARFPALLVTLDPSQSSARPDVLRALLDVAADGTVVRFSLVDSRGETQLRRTLPAPTHGRSATECLALADTLAAIVERYLGGIISEPTDAVLTDGLPTPFTPSAPGPAVSAPGKPPRRAAFLLVGLAWRMPTGARPSDGEIEGRLGAEFEITSSYPRVAGLITLGAAPAITVDNSLDEGRKTTLRRFPARLGASLKVPAGPGWVEPALAVVLDLLAVSSGAGPSTPASERFRLGPGVEVGVGYRIKMAGIFHLRPRATLGVAVKRYDVGVQTAPDAVVLGTPRAYASFGIDTGVLFQ